MSFICAGCEGKFSCKDTRSYGTEVVRLYKCPTCGTGLTTREIIEVVRGDEGQAVLNKRERVVEKFTGMQWVPCSYGKPQVLNWHPDKQAALARGEIVVMGGVQYRYTR